MKTLNNMREWRFRDLGVNRKVGIFFLLFTINAFFNYLLVKHFRSQQTSDSFVIDTSGRNRSLSQQIAFYSEMVSKGNNQVKSELKKVIDLHDQSLAIIKEGGLVPGLSTERSVPPTSERVLPTLILAEELWQDYKQQAEVILMEPPFIDSTYTAIVLASDSSAVEKEITTQISNPKMLSAIQFIENNAASMMSRNNRLVKMYVKESRDGQETLGNILLVLLLVNLLIISSGYLILNKYVTKPLKQVSNVSEQLAVGDLNHRVDHVAHDEVGMIGNAINQLSDNLRLKSDFAEEVGTGNYDVQYEPLSEQDKLGQSLINMRLNLSKSFEEGKKRSWVNEGIAKFSDLLYNGGDNINELSSQVIGGLISYMKVNQGAMFVLGDSEDQPYLELASCHAWGRKKYVDRKIPLGEGLIGQAWREEETVFLTDVPEDYITITSGLGQANPRSILIVPIKSHSEVLGVIELASFEILEAYQIGFVEKLAENIAATFSRVRINERTNELLEQSQAQSEMLRSQEEEMRQNLEELTATQEEMDRRKSRVEGTLNALDVSLSTVEFEPDGKIMNANDNFLRLLGYEREDILGQHHDIFLPHEDRQSNTHVNLWSKLKQGQTAEGEFVRLTKSGSKIWIKGNYSPVLKDGELVKIVKVAYDVTEAVEERKQLQDEISILSAEFELLKESVKPQVVVNQNE
ncbi:MAG: PAS domain S-box protein [Bacteroidota bacterium]